MEVHLQKSHMTGDWEVFIFERRGNLRIPFKMTFEPLPPVGCGESMKPSARFEDHDAKLLGKAIAVALTEAEFMEKSTAPEAELRATVKHLEDMRIIAMKYVGV